MLGLGLVGGSLVVLWLPHSSDIPLAIWSSWSSGVPVRARGGI